MLRRSHGNIYLDAQIFTGFSFIAAALCSWFIRSWKITDTNHKEVAKRRREDVGMSRTYLERETPTPWISYAYTMFRNLFVWMKV